MRAVPNMSSHVLCAVITWHFCKKSLGFDDQLNEVTQGDQQTGELPLTPTTDAQPAVTDSVNHAVNTTVDKTAEKVEDNVVDYRL